MGYFPFYMDIEGKLCVIAGGGKVAYRKVCDLLPFGVCIRVIALDFNAADGLECGKYPCIRLPVQRENPVQ